MDATWQRLLVRQKGLLTAEQARVYGITSAMVHRRVHGHRPQWQPVLPRVYATFLQPLTTQQQAVAACLYAGPGAALTGNAALHWQGVAYLPREVRPTPVDVLVPFGRECASRQFVRVARSRRELAACNINWVPCVSVARAAADCARRLTSYEATLAMASSVLNGRRTTLDALAAELAAGPTRGSRHLRSVLLQASANVRSVPEGQLLDLIKGTSLPPPLVNVPITIDGRTYLPDLRWGRFIVEIESRLHHLLVPGSWDATQHRRLALEAAGYHVLPITPEQIRDDPQGVLTAIMVGYRTHAAA